MPFPPIAIMKLLLTFSFVLLTNPFSSSASAALSQPPSVPLLSIPLYNGAMMQKLNQTVKSSANLVHDYLQMDATANLYPDDNVYAVFLWIGTPTQIAFVRLDTRSHFTWFQCKPCSGCYPQSRPLFDPRTSSTLQELSCNSDTCSIPQMRDVFPRCSQGSCRYNMKYADRSRSSGRVVTDILTLVHSNTVVVHSNTVVKDFVMGCGNSHEGPFRTHFSGSLGLGRGPLSVQSQLNAKAFSLCLVSPKSETLSSLNFYGSPPTKDNYDSGSIMVPLSQNDRNPHYYFVQFVGIGIDGFMLDIPSRVWGYGLNYDGGVVIDSGSTVMHLPSDAYSVFSSEIRRRTRNFTHRSGPEGLEFCYADEAVNVYPVIEYYFENGSIEGEDFVTLKLSTEQTLFRPEERVVCLAFREGRGSALTVIGNTQLQGTLLTYDLANELLVFTPKNC